MMTLAQAAEGARQDSRRYRTCIAITAGDPETGYGWCPLEAFDLLHGPLARAGIVTIVDLVGTQYIAEAVARAAMARNGGGL